MTLASPADTAVHGAYPAQARLAATRAQDRPDYPFQGRIGTGEFPAEPGRYHLYSSWTCPYAQRAAIVRSLVGLEEVVGLSYVDDERDGRGWAFREQRGADPVNGFAFLSEAYDATEPGYPGHISVPVLWDEAAGEIVSNHYPDITLDLATRFEKWADPEVSLYPKKLRPQIDELNDRIFENVNTGVTRVAAARTQQEYEDARAKVVKELESLDARLADSRFLLGDALTEPDVRLWVTLIRFDPASNPQAGISERPLKDFPHLWSYTRALYEIPAFRDTTDLEAISRGATPLETPGVTRIRVEPSRPV